MKVYCLGDSNTYGYDPRSFFGDRYDKDFRWVDILSKQTGWEIINDGENGRRIPLQPIKITQTMDLLIVMLGTNDLLQGCGAMQTASQMKRFLSETSFAKEKTVLIAPPPLVPGAWVSGPQLIEESSVLAQFYRDIADCLGIGFADAGAWNVDIAFDGVHFTENGHKCFAKGILKYIEEKMRAVI